MGQVESFEADESQTDIEQHHPNTKRARIAPRPSAERRHFSRNKRYSTTSTESDAFLHRQPILHRDTQKKFLQHNHDDLTRQNSYSRSNHILKNFTIQPTLSHKSKSTLADSEPTQLKDGKLPCLYKHSNDETSHNKVATPSYMLQTQQNDCRSQGACVYPSQFDEVPTITVTDFEESEINFDPEEFKKNTSTPKPIRRDSKCDLQEEQMDLSITRHDAGASAGGGYQAFTAAGGGSAASGYHQAGERRSTSAAANSYQQGAIRRDTSVQRGSSAAAASSGGVLTAKSSRKSSSSKSSKKRSQSESRAKSDSSFSDISAASKSSKGSTAKKTKEETKNKIKNRLAKAGHKGSITDRWQGVVNEFQDSKGGSKKEHEKEHRRVGKIANFDKYENVKQVFGKGLPLPMQHGPQNGRIQHMEGETASEGSTHSWTALTPMKKTQRGVLIANAGHSAVDEADRESRSYIQGINAARRNASLGEQRMLTGESTRQVSKSLATDNIKGTGAVAKTSSTTVMGQNNKKGVKFQKKKFYHIEDQAVTIVDDAIQRAWELIYGKRRSSAESSSSRRHSSRKSTVGLASSSSSANNQRLNRVNNIENIYKSENILSESVIRDHRNRRAMSHGGRKASHIRPVSRPWASEGNAPALAPGGIYELDITPYGGRKKKQEDIQEQQQTERKYSEGSVSKLHVAPSHNTRKSFTIPPLVPTSGQSIQTSSSQHSSFQVYDKSETPPPPAPPPRQINNYSNIYQTQAQQDEVQTKSKVNPPTITRGTVTRVLHELNDPNFSMPAGQMLQSLRSLNESEEYSTSTWPLTKNPPTDTFDNSIFTSKMPESVNLDTVPVSNYGGLPGGVYMQQGIGMQQPQSVTANPHIYQRQGFDRGIKHSTQMQHSPASKNTYSIGLQQSGNLFGHGEYQYADPLERPASTPAILEHNMYSPPTMYPQYATMPHYQHQRFYQTHSGSMGNLAAPSAQYQRNQPMDLYFDASKMQGYQGYSNISSPVSPPMRNVYTQSSSVNDLMDYGAYSNEPIIVADLIDKQPTISSHRHDQYQQHAHLQSPLPQQGTFYSSRGPPSVSMGKQQTLNFFVFGNKAQSETDLRYANYDIEPRNTRDDFDVSGYYYDRERQRNDYVDYDILQDQSDVYETRSEPDYTNDRMRQILIHHKQTQTLPPPRKKMPPVMKRIEKKEMQAYRHAPPSHPPQKEVHHKETTHFITKERQIEKMPPLQPKKFSHSVQTDLSGSVVNRQKQRPKVQKYSSATQYEKPPSPPKQRDTKVQVTNRVFAPRITETRDFFKESTKPMEPEEPVQTIGINVPITLKPSPEENVITIIDNFNQPARVEDSLITTSKEIAKPESDTESEMEIIETVEIEEREQRISMAIFEEVEFSVSRTKDGKTETQKGYGSDLLPFDFPGKYEATVDRRKQKCTQVRECTKGGSHRYEYDSNVHKGHPAPNYQSAIEMKRESNHVPDEDNLDLLVQKTEKMHINSLPNDNNNHTYHEEYTQRSHKGQHQGQHNQTHHHHGHNRSQFSSISEEGKLLDSFPEPITQSKEIKVIETGHSAIPSNSSGYSSSDTAASTAAHHFQSINSISAGGPFEEPDDNEETTRTYTSELRNINLTPTASSYDEPDDDEQLSNNRRYVSRFDPGNVYFTVPEWSTMDSNELFYNLSNEEKSVTTRHSPDGNDNDSLPGSLPDKTISPDVTDGKRVHKQGTKSDLPKLRTRVVKDKDGNLVKITEVENTVTKTSEFTEAKPVNVNAEQLRGSEYMEMDMAQITEGQKETVQVETIQDENVEEDEEDEKELYAIFPEVTGETTIALEPVEYDEQEKSLGLKEDLSAGLEEQKYLYDLKTATLQPMVTKDNRSGAMLMQYGYNDMITEL